LKWGVEVGKRAIVLLILIIFLIFSAFEAYLLRNADKRPEVEIEQRVEVQEIQEDYYAIRDNGRYGYINRAGLVVIKPQFEDAYNFSENLARVARYHKYGFIDKTGTTVIEQVFNDAGDFSEGLAMVGIDNKYGFIDSSGKQAVPLQYESVSAFSEGLAGVYIQGRWGYINNKGEVVIQPKYDNAGFFKDGLAPVSEKGIYGYINKKGQYEIKPGFDYAYSFADGLAQIGMDNKYGFIDTKGTVVIQPTFESTQDFSEGMAAVLQNDKWGYINKEGSFVISPDFENADSFSEGRAAVNDGNNWGYIDIKGNMVIKPQYSYAEGFYKGLASVRYEDALSYIDRSGKLIWYEVEVTEIQGSDGVLGRLIKLKLKNDQYDLLIKYPQAVDMNNKELQNKINMLLKSQSGTEYKGQKDEFYRQDYDVMLNKAGIMSILNNSYLYMKGAAHGMSMRSSINIDMTDGRLYTLKDLFKPSADYKTKLNTIIKKKLLEDNTPLLREFEGIKDNQEYYLTDKELVVYYQLYDYTPYAYGFLEFYIPYESISDMIDKQGPIARIMESK